MSRRVPKAWRGLHAWRYKSNPLEERLAAAWAEQNECNDPRTSTLAYLLCDGDQHFTVPPSDRDRLVASTVIQWIGSPVGVQWVLGTIAADPASELGLTGRDVVRAQALVPPAPVFTAREIEFMTEESEMELDTKKAAVMRRILKKMKAGNR
jgi:hypothetical protein